MATRDLITRAKFSLREQLGSRATLIPWLARGSKWELGAVREDSTVCIEAFPRSANTFAVAAFKLAGNDGHIARHSHLAGQVLRAIELGVPSLVLVREPVGSVLSLKIRRPALGFAQMLKSYDRFYRLLEPKRAQFTVARFEEVTSDFGAVMSRMNDERGSKFSIFQHDEAGKAAVFEEIEAMHVEFQKRTGDGQRDPNMIAVPQSGRSSLKEELTLELESARFAGLLERAKARYESFLSPR